MEYMTDDAVKNLERKFELQRRVLKLMNLVVAEWESDPTSVQCFDLQLVREAKSVCKELNGLNSWIEQAESEGE